MSPGTPSETPSSPKPRPATPKKPDRLRSTPIPPTPPSIDMRQGVLSVANGDLVNGHGSNNLLEVHADLDLTSPVPRSIPANGAFVEISEQQAEAGASQSAEETDIESEAISGRPNNGTHEANVMEKLRKSVKGLKGAKSALRSWPGHAHERLCQACQALDLAVEKFVIDPEAPRSQFSPNFWGKRSMGTLSDIQGRQWCPLCRLLLQATMSDGQLPAVAANAQEGNNILNIGSAPPPECYLYWTVEGRERVKDNKSARVRTVKRTRRLCIEWTHKTQEKAYIVLVAPEGKFTADGRINNDKWERPTLFLGRLLTSLQQTNIELIRSWLNVCMKHHQAECQVHQDLKERFTKELYEQGSTFTVIDVLRMKLAALPFDHDKDGTDTRYIALSYTWGAETRISGGHGVPPKSKVMEEQMFKATKENVNMLEQENGIQHALRKNMPKAIQNAIVLTKKLNYRYLWVDSLCITQDDPISWELNAEVMDVIYGNAEFTICAADGDSAQAGLKALFNPENSQYARHAEEFVEDYQLDGRERLQLLLSWPSESYIERSRWNDRAWTFQERMLSRRCLIFVAGRMYFQCRSTTMSEDIYSEVEAAGWSVELHGAPARMLQRLEIDPVSVYKKCLEMYTQRKLSYEKDILAAFSGIANMIHGSLGDNCEPIFGLPNSHFDWALLWEPEERPEVREGGGKRFPTWSWCGWKGKKITYKPATVAGLEIDLHEWLLNHTWITYYIRDGQGNLRLIWNPLRHESSKDIEDRWRGYDSPKTGLPKSSHATSCPEYDYHGRPFNRQLPRRGRVLGFQNQQFIRTVGPYRRRVAILPAASPEPKRKGIQRKFRDDERYLQFWTWSADFLLGEERPNDKFSDGSVVGTGLKRFAILDAEGDLAGFCILDESWTKAAREGKVQQFIALSDARDFAMSEYVCWNFYTEEERDLVPWQLYNVMMIWYEEDNPDVAVRGGIGKVYKSAFGYNEEKDWKEIILG